ncbi:MAG: hypothetical protein VKL39_10470 [Leptolyngbyaceae bacterium]|nr:hypothetical protein [Leptolyngbyaceae bacterium]
MKHRTLRDPSFPHRLSPMAPAGQTALSATADAAAQPSSRTLDFCLLAICSCILSLLCHQPISHSTLTSTATSAPGNAPTATPVSIDFLVKAGLLTSQRDDEELVQDS